MVIVRILETSTMVPLSLPNSQAFVRYTGLAPGAGDLQKIHNYTNYLIQSHTSGWSSSSQDSQESHASNMRHAASVLPTLRVVPIKSLWVIRGAKLPASSILLTERLKYMPRLLIFRAVKTQTLERFTKL